MSALERPSLFFHVTGPGHSRWINVVTLHSGVFAAETELLHDVLQCLDGISDEEWRKGREYDKKSLFSEDVGDVSAAEWIDVVGLSNKDPDGKSLEYYVPAVLEQVQSEMKKIALTLAKLVGGRSTGRVVVNKIMPSLYSSLGYTTLRPHYDGTRAVILALRPLESCDGLLVVNAVRQDEFQYDPSATQVEYDKTTYITFAQNHGDVMIFDGSNYHHYATPTTKSARYSIVVFPSECV